jgi:transposase-like protein
MENEGKHYTPEFKKEVAQKALDQDKKNLDKLSDKYDVPVSVILMWATEFEKGGADAFEAVEEDTGTAEKEESNVDVEVEVSDPKVADAFEHGVMLDQLNIKRLTFWSVFGIILVLIFVQALFELYEYNQQLTQERVSAQSQYYQANQLKSEARQKLNSFGVVDLENGIYRVPIDSVINEMAADEE